MEIDGKASGAIGLANVQSELPVSVSGWNRASAKSLLRIAFSEKDCERFLRLESKSAQTELTEAEQSELDGYESISVFMEFLKRGARFHLAELGDINGGSPSSSLNNIRQKNQ